MARSACNIAWRAEMGFFSAVKKFFGAKKESAEPTTPEETASDSTPIESLQPTGENAAHAGEELAAGEAGSTIQTVDEGQSASARDENIVSPPSHAEADTTFGQPAIVDREDEAAPDDPLIGRLRQAEPRLSTWLAIVLEGVDEAGDTLWARLRLLLGALEAPPAEIDVFVDDFRKWLERMEYVHVDEFRSELQYRLAIALDLEDEDDERNRLLLKLSSGLARTREKLGRGLNRLFSGSGELNQEFWEELEEMFIMADLGCDAAAMLVERIRNRASAEKITEAGAARHLLLAELEEVFRQPRRITAVNKPEVILMIGVNGVGKTTTIAKLAHRERMRGKKVLIAAADTFRAAAVEQLQVWAERVGADFLARPQGSDPASVAWAAMDRAMETGADVVFIDTAGRLQTKVNLMEELGKIRQVVAKKHMGAPHRSILVLDATTGQNALSQARLFREAAGANELILTKLDGTAKGGVAIAVAMREKLPITYVGLGEKLEDLRPFNGDDYARALLGEQNP